MIVRQRVAALATALLLGLAVSTTFAGQAEARDNQPDNGVRCVYYNQETGEMEFYLPGQALYLQDANGQYHTLICLANGNWGDANAKPNRK